MTNYAIEVLHAARCIVNYAQSEGLIFEKEHPRVICEHLGAVIGDSILQAGLNYSTVVRPRVQAILQSYPSHNTISSLVELIKEGETGEFLCWHHGEKIRRFNELVLFLQSWGVENAQDLREELVSSELFDEIQSVKGVGPKTVDYMACLIGVESIAVDRHVRSFAKAAGVESDSYHFLRESFCCAADLLSLPRREFDSWLWSRAAKPERVQLSLPV
ncbi:hypothetical protein [Kangiella sp. M94]